MNYTIPEKALVALPDFNLNGGAVPRPTSAHGAPAYVIVPPEKAFIPFFDRSFQFGDSLYEVTRSYSGVLFSLDEHLRRLKNSSKLAMYEKFPDEDGIQQMVRETCRSFFNKYGNTDVYVRITVSRGVGAINIDPSFAGDPYTVVYVRPLDPSNPKHYTEGVHFAVVSRHRNLKTALDPAMKSGNYLNNVLAIAEAKKMGAQDAIMLNYQGFVTEGTTNNVYYVKQGTVYTSPLSAGILEGITRDWIFKLCKQSGISIQEKLYTASDLEAADEMFFSSATKEVVPITKLSGKPVGNGKPGPVAIKLRQLLQTLIDAYTNQHKESSLYV